MAYCHPIHKEKWKLDHQMKYPLSFFHQFILYSHLLLILFLLCGVQHVSSQDYWDGIIITQSDYQGLQAFKNELIDPKGYLKSWNDSGYGACSGGWAGIKCAQGQVIVIQLPWKGLGGRISDKIGQFQSLRKLSLHDNVISGSIPQALGFLPNLRGVQLFNNRLFGSIPPSLGVYPALQTLHLANNSLTGVIPETLGNSTKLYSLNLSFNSLSGSIPVSLTRSISLRFLDLSHNNLTGPIPDYWGEAEKSGSFAQLESLLLDNNYLSGNLPASLGKLSRLRTLDLSYNSINGSLPISFLNLSSLTLLNLENNDLDSKIPQSFDRLGNLSILNLKRNHFNGEIPPNIANMSVLTQLDLSQNNLSGEIPDSLSNLKNLKFLNVSYNNLSGSVPDSLAQKFNSSSFIGNIQLCGFSGSTPCPSSSPVSKVRKLSTKDIILIVAGALLAVLITLCCILLCCLLRKKSAAKSKTDKTGGKGAPPTAREIEEAGETGGKLVHFDGPMAFTADDLLCATAEVMGKSTYGTVYKTTLEDGSQVAVKRLREKITKSQTEFESEVNVLGKIRHPNLLALRAYYVGPKGEKLLVFDYMPLGSLATFLHARGPDTLINWPTRMKIAQGTTRGLLYLHNNENIIHGNLTSSNVLLDVQANAKISDYGLSRLMTGAANSNVIATAGALGYRAPELSKLKKANAKTDVYSLGVIMLELLTGKSPGEAMNGVDLPQWVASTVKEEWTNEVFDLELMKSATTIGDELLNTLKLALNCVDPFPDARPEVQDVLRQLEEIRPEATLSEAGAGAVVGSPYSDLKNSNLIRTYNMTILSSLLNMEAEFYKTHGIRQIRTGWADGPEFVTQCPIRPGGSYSYRFTVNGQVGTLWWHAHSSWLRATVYGALIIHPKEGSSYPFTKPKRETPILLGEWWNANPMNVIKQAKQTGGAPNISDAYTINGQPGDLYNCSTKETVVVPIDSGETNLLRVINAALNQPLFFTIANHPFTVVGADAAYVKPFTTSVIMLGPGQTTDVLIKGNQPAARYYMAAQAYFSAQNAAFDNTTTTAILEYKSAPCPAKKSGQPTIKPIMPRLPAFNDTKTATGFTFSFRSLQKVRVPTQIDESLFFTVGLGIQKCPKNANPKTCQGPINGTRFSASMNNVSFVLPQNWSLLQAHSHGIPGVFTTDFPATPPVKFDYTGNVSQSLWQPIQATKLYRLKYGAQVQIVLQDTSIISTENHPIHLHGYDFYIIAEGFGNFNPKTDTAKFNLIDPPQRNTAAVPVGGWSVIRFVADNPGVWLMHCHLDVHISWGLATALLVENGVGVLETLEKAPADLPIC
ncbi:hypothetical protein ACFE04_029913 [Oxalis oulophora]